MAKDAQAAERHRKAVSVSPQLFARIEGLIERSGSGATPGEWVRAALRVAIQAAETREGELAQLRAPAPEEPVRPRIPVPAGPPKAAPF